jgi:hypothetical protein
MATTTPNYGWDVPTSTDYVKDGAVAIETLGDDIDATLFSVTGGKTVGYQLLASGTLSGASDVIMDNVTSAYSNYRILLSGTTSTQQGQIAINLRNSATGNLMGAVYSFTQMYYATNNTTVSITAGYNNANGTIIGLGGSSGFSGVIDLDMEANNPSWGSRFTGNFGAQNSTIFHGAYNATVSGGVTGIRLSGVSCTITGEYRIYGAK